MLALLGEKFDSLGEKIDSLGETLGGKLDKLDEVLRSLPGAVPKPATGKNMEKMHHGVASSLQLPNLDLWCMRVYKAASWIAIFAFICIMIACCPSVACWCLRL